MRASTARGFADSTTSLSRGMEVQDMRLWLASTESNDPGMWVDSGLTESSATATGKRYLAPWGVLTTTTETVSASLQGVEHEVHCTHDLRRDCACGKLRVVPGSAG